MNISDIPDKIRERIAKLLAYAEDAKKRDSQAELENAMARVQEILVNYNLDLETLRSSQKTEEVKIDQYAVYDGLLPKNEGRWIILLYLRLAKYYFCLAYTVNKGHSGIRIVGEKTNREVFIYTVEQLIPRIRALAKASWSQYTGDEKRQSYLRGFMEGCSRGIRDRLESELNQMMEGDNSQNIHALVIQRNNGLTQWLSDNNVRLVAGVSSNYSAQDGKARGYAVGKTMEIRKGLSNTSASNQFLLGN
jgi:hypothetical protein